MHDVLIRRGELCYPDFPGSEISLTPSTTYLFQRINVKVRGCGSSVASGNTALGGNGDTTPVVPLVPSSVPNSSSSPNKAKQKTSINEKNSSQKLSKRKPLCKYKKRLRKKKSRKMSGKQPDMLVSLHAALLQLFDALDKDSDGELDAKEASVYLGTLDASFSTARGRSILGAFKTL